MLLPCLDESKFWLFFILLLNNLLHFSHFHLYYSASLVLNGLQTITMYLAIHLSVRESIAPDQIGIISCSHDNNFGNILLK